ncbi:MAG: sulfatase-like hydrolase/transferase, partial [Bacteroidales bacterium]
MNKQIILFPASILLLASCQNHQSEADRIQKPNVLFILADDLGYHDLSCMGSEYYETPHIDRIASEGMIFTDGYANCQVCSPSRASIMSGKFPARHGITDWIGAPTGEDWRKAGRFNKLLPPEYVTHLAHEYITLPEAMKETGYKTFFAGKWHIGGKGSWPEDRGLGSEAGRAELVGIAHRGRARWPLAGDYRGRPVGHRLPSGRRKRVVAGQ